MCTFKQQTNLEKVINFLDVYFKNIGEFKTLIKMEKSHKLDEILN